MTNVPQVPTITIVTPSFNQGEFLAETIESVISQAGDFRIDYIIVDGGSTDNSVAIIRRYDALIRTDRYLVNCRGLTFRWLSERDRGQADALAKGFRIAKGELLAWLNSDDVYQPGALQAVANCFIDHPETGLVYGDAHYCDAAGTVIGRYRTEAYEYAKLAWFNFICQPSTFFRKEVFDTVGGLDDTLQFAMDYDLWVRIGKRFTCRHLPVSLSMYRLHESSKTLFAETLFSNSEESLRLAMKYFAWAPLTRIYNSCSTYCRARLPEYATRSKSMVVLASVACTVFRSIWLNRGIRSNDLALLTRGNFRKLFKSRVEIMTGTTVDK